MKNWCARTLRLLEIASFKNMQMTPPPADKCGPVSSQCPCSVHFGPKKMAHSAAESVQFVALFGRESRPGQEPFDIDSRP